jgi:hypothetical protein
VTIFVKQWLDQFVTMAALGGEGGFFIGRYKPAISAATIVVSRRCTSAT